MAAPTTVSGTRLATLFVVGAVGLVAFIVLFAPRLQDQAAALLGDDSEVLQMGRLGGVEWVVTAISGEDGTCVAIDLDGRPAARTCGDGPLSAVATASGEDGYVLAGMTDAPQVRVELDSGLAPLPRVYRPRGFSSGFYATTVESGVAVERVVGLDRDERELAVRDCEGGPLATSDGEAPGCRMRQSGGQG